MRDGGLADAEHVSGRTEAFFVDDGQERAELGKVEGHEQLS
jgi:hypothetical protein